ncbi:Relaxin receptor 1 like protein [Argiope bruennichi]|uniref:Relaxin receptor 1 like protein n=1 Tax=Argiope bruennichi TaxID=94029 RepID=A0A8T0F4U8_ARGBR|nr:Relaxin receptor 1 like protein [Argiope bruennichi]
MQIHPRNTPQLAAFGVKSLPRVRKVDSNPLRAHLLGLSRMADNGRGFLALPVMRVITIQLIILFFCIIFEAEVTATILSAVPTVDVEPVINGRSNVVCGAEEFVCGNTTRCIERIKHCDGIKHCDDGEDEDGCADAHGSLDSLVKAIKEHGELKDVIFDKSLDNCSLGENVPPFCECRFYTFLFCENHNLTSVPKGIGNSITKLALTNTSLRSLPAGAFSEYKGLKIIHIEGNVIRVLSPGPFSEMSNVTFLQLMKNQIEIIEPGAFKGLDNLRWLLLQNNHLKKLNMSVLEDIQSIEVLDLTDNRLTQLGTFPPLDKLFWLGLGNNRIERIAKSTFRELASLEVLILKENVIEEIEETAFSSLETLLELNDISHNRLKYLKPKLFYKLRNLNKLNLEFNLITSLPMGIFRGLDVLKSLDLQGLDIHNIDIQMFHPLTELKFIYFKKFLYCSYAPYVRICTPKTDGLSSTEHLLVFPALRMSVWFVALMTCAGNTLVLSWRVLSRKEDKVLSLFIKNLAFADLLMGIYLVAIGSQDLSFRDSYNKYAHAWMTSNACNACGILAMVSSEVSVLILSLITIERHRCIRTNVRVITVSGARFCLAIVWIIGFTLALIPIFKWSEEKGFYSSNGLCFPLHIDDAYNLGYQYSAFIFFGINFTAVMLIISLYASMFYTIKRDRESARPVILKKHEDTVLAFRFFFIVLTDSLCWIPIVIIKLLALAGVTISHNLYACVVVFILPINSALNPVLYTIAAPTELRRKIERWLQRAFIWLQRFDCIIKSSVSNSSSLTRTVTTQETRYIPTSSGGELELCITAI